MGRAGKMTASGVKTDTEWNPYALREKKKNTKLTTECDITPMESVQSAAGVYRMQEWFTAPQRLSEKTKKCGKLEVQIRIVVSNIPS